MLNLWDEVCKLASTINFSNEEDFLVWQFSSKGIYSVQSLYKIVNFRGIKPVLVPSIWKIKIPPRVQYFLWLLSKNKLLTRDNLSKRRKVKDPTCLFCAEKETISHLFFYCVVAQYLWKLLSKIFDVQLGNSLDSIGKFWLSNKRNGILNLFTLAGFWSLWKLRNDLCFQRNQWRCMAILLYKLVSLVQNWEILYSEEQRQVIQCKVVMIKEVASQELWLPWK